MGQISGGGGNVKYAVCLKLGPFERASKASEFIEALSFSKAVLGREGYAAMMPIFSCCALWICPVSCACSFQKSWVLAT